MSIKLRVIVFIVFYSVFSCAQKTTSLTTNSKSIQLSASKLKIMDSTLHTFVDDGRIASIQTAIVTKDSVLHFDTYGFADIEANRKINDNSLFRIFSMTKPIVSVALMQLYEQGKFKLEDPLHKYLPEFKEMMIYSDSSGLKKAKHNIKIIDLLRHSSGLGYGRGQNNFVNQKHQESNLYHAKNNKEYSKKASQLPLSFEPGTNWEYGISTNICGYLIEVLSGKSLDTYLKKYVLQPLKMNSTFFQIPEDRIQDFTVGYGLRNDSILYISESSKNNRYTQKVTLFNGGGGLVSTTNDYIQFCKMLLNNGSLNGKQIIKPETLSLMTKDHLNPVREHTKRLRILPRETGFGLGFSIASKTRKGERGVYGWGGAVGTYFRVDPYKQIAYIMMIQVSPYRQLGLRETFQELVYNAIDN